MGEGRGRHGNHARGSEHYRWNHYGRLFCSQGYARIRVGVEHPLADHQGYAYEHRLVWASAHGAIPKGKELHHLNGDKLDNRLENLQLVKKTSHPRGLGRGR